MHHLDRNAHNEWVVTPHHKPKLTIQKMTPKPRPSLAPGLFLVLLMLSCGSAMGAF
jgi:hypothetical protein